MASTSRISSLDLRVSKGDPHVIDLTNSSDDEYETDEDFDSEDEVLFADPFKRTKLMCSYEGCNFHCGRLRSMERHVYRTHDKEKKYVCTYEGCDKRYIVAYHLTRHVQRFHEKKHLTKIVRIKCTVESCEKHFNTQQSLRRHLKTIHENRKTYQCTECTFQTSHGGSYTKHMRKHDPNKKPKQKIYNCPLCNESFHKWSELQKHRKTSHLASCPTCQRTFNHKKNLKAHMQLHEVKDKNIRYACTYEGCDKFYYQQNNLDEHIKTVHEEIHFKCPVEHCERTFTTSRKSQYHIKQHVEGNLVVERRPPAVKKAKGIQNKIAQVPTRALLTGVDLDEEVAQKFLEGKGDEVELEYESFTATSDTDGEEVHVPKKFRIKT